MASELLLMMGFEVKPRSPTARKTVPITKADVLIAMVIVFNEKREFYKIISGINDAQKLPRIPRMATNYFELPN